MIRGGIYRGHHSPFQASKCKTFRVVSNVFSIRHFFARRQTLSNVFEPDSMREVLNRALPTFFRQALDTYVGHTWDTGTANGEPLRYDTLRSEAPMSLPRQERQALNPRPSSSFSRSTAVGVESEPNSITIISPTTMHVRTLVKLGTSAARLCAGKEKTRATTQRGLDTTLAQPLELCMITKYGEHGECWGSSGWWNGVQYLSRPPPRPAAGAEAGA